MSLRERKQEILKDLPSGPGIYRMLDESGVTLYVGKARNLKKRISSYFRATGLAPRTEAMMQQAQDLDVTLTHTEAEALLLENNLIKSEKPRFNVLLRDDKSYPYIFLSDETYPRLSYHRGAKRGKGRYFGPYPSAVSVRESMNLLQKMFGVRQCRNSFFNNRSRPCLQYQLKRCSGSCVDLISPEDYAVDVNNTVMFLEGKSKQLNEQMIQRMDAAAEALDYETAAVYRDRIKALHRVQERQYIEGEDTGDVDLVAIALEQQVACIEVSVMRGGRHLGSRSYFPRSQAAQSGDPGEILSAFVSQYYVDKSIPRRIYLSEPAADADLLAAALSQTAGRKVELKTASRGDARQWMQRAQLNAAEALRRRLASRENLRGRFEALQEALGLEQVPERIECFDISHTQGEATVASCVVFTPDGPLKTDYRRYNIDGIEPGDDYGAMRQALTRRFRKLVDGQGKVPDIVIIDGGKGQLSSAEAALEELQLQGLLLLGIAKGEGRRAENDRLFLSGMGEATILPGSSPPMHLVQQVRDEAHRFAIGGHRRQRGKARRTSPLEGIEGVGEKRRQSLLKQLGGLQEVARAGVEDLAQVPGISPVLAQRIYDAFHEQDT